MCQRNYKPDPNEELLLNIGGKPVKAYKSPKEHKVEFDAGEGNLYSVTCKQGHKFTYIYPEERFELLFKSGVQAYFDGYYREAVSSIAASVERLYEFAIKVICHASELDSGEFGNAWSVVSKQSERQYGAFVFLFFYATKKTPPKLSNGKIEFRNNVIHKGDFPTQSKSLDYMSDSLDLIYKILVALKAIYPDSMRKVYDKNTTDLIQQYKMKTGVHWQSSQTLSIATTILKDLDHLTMDGMIRSVESDRKILND